MDAPRSPSSNGAHVSKSAIPDMQRSHFTLWQCCQCHHGSMTVSATPACPECSHAHCETCEVTRIKLPASRAGTDDPPKNLAPADWPLASPGRLREVDFEVIETRTTSLDPSEMSPGPAGSSPYRETIDSETNTLASSDAGGGTPATSPATSSSMMSPVNESDEVDDDGPVERHFIGSLLEDLRLPETGILDPALESLLTEYQRWRQNPPLVAPRNGQLQGNGSVRGSFIPPAWPLATTSTEQPLAPDGFPGFDREPIEETKTLGVPSHQTYTALFACPFWKHNSVDWRDCFPYKLRRIKDVKQHLRRAHMKFSVCDRCGSEFRDRQALEAHQPDASSPTCTLRQFQVRWLSEKQKEMLKKRCQGSVEAQWYAIWDIIFPGSPKPDSPYLDESLSEDLNSFIAFFLSRDPNPERIRGIGHPDGSSLLAAQTQDYSFLRSGLLQLLTEWSLARGHSTTVIQVLYSPMDYGSDASEILRLGNDVELGVGDSSGAGHEAVDTSHEQMGYWVPDSVESYGGATFPGEEFIDYTAYDN